MITLIAGVSVLLFAAAVFLWARSYNHPRFIYYDWLDSKPHVEVRSLQWWSDNGAFRCTTDWTLADTEEAARFLEQTGPYGFQKIDFDRLPSVRKPSDGFFFRRIWERNKDLGLTVSVHSVGFPYWFCCILFCVFPGAWLASWKRRRRWDSEGRCFSCGYDMRATPARCPECGRVPRSDRQMLA